MISSLLNAETLLKTPLIISVAFENSHGERTKRFWISIFCLEADNDDDEYGEVWRGMMVYGAVWLDGVCGIELVEWSAVKWSCVSHVAQCEMKQRGVMSEVIK